MNLTDKEIIKIAEECVGDVPPCNTRPFDENSIATSECMGEVIKNLIGIINRLQDEKQALINGQETLQNTIVEQNAEIERLNIRNKALTDIAKNYDWKFAKAKSEAIKKFAERLKEKNAENKHILPSVNITIDNLVKELTERKE